MKTQTLSYTYDPRASSLTIYDGEKAIGGFKGEIAERKFTELIFNDVEIKITNMDTENSLKSKIKRLRALWSIQGIDKHRDAILEPYGVTSTANLNEQQLDELLADYSIKGRQPVDERTRILRSEVLTLLNKLGIYQTNGDWARVNEYLMDKRIAGKMLYHLNYNELPNLVRKLRGILDKQEGRIRINNQEN